MKPQLPWLDRDLTWWDGFIPELYKVIVTKEVGIVVGGCLVFLVLVLYTARQYQER